MIIANLNINSVSSEFKQLRSSFQDKVDILDTAESKLEFFFPINQFLILGYFKPFNFDRNRNKGDILLFKRKDRPCKKSTQHEHPDDIEGIFVEINLIRKPNFFATDHALTPAGYFYDHIGETLDDYPAGNYMFKVNNRNISTRCEHISHLALVFLSLTLSR